MADLSITAANVEAQGGAKTARKLAGATITAGQVVTINSSERAVLASDATAALARVAGIALHGASADQPLEYQTSGRIDLGATLAVGKHYVLSTSGGIAPVDDVAGSEFASYIGFAVSTSILQLQPLTATVAAAGAVS